MSWKAAGVLAVLLAMGSARAEKCPNMLIVLDRSGSMSAGTKWSTAVNAINSFTAQRQEVMRFGLLLFPAPNEDCGSGLFVHHSDFYASAPIAKALARVGPGGMTPTADAIASAGASPDMLDGSRRRFIILVTDGDPTCPDPNNQEADLQLAVESVARVAQEGIKTFVIGFGENVSPDRLDRLAEAGMTPRAGGTCNDPKNPGSRIPCKYYEASDRASLAAAFDEIATLATGELQGNSCDDSCYGIGGCPDGERCTKKLHVYGETGEHILNLGTCTPDPCSGVRCGRDQFCREGACVAACTSPCPDGTVCVDGSCQTDPCVVSGACGNCEPACARYLICNDGRCVDDPCRSVSCPSQAPYCYRGSCYASTGTEENPIEGDPGESDPKRCGCSGSSALGALLILPIALLWRRARHR